MSLTIYSSNRMENLVEALARVVREPLSSPFTPEVIVVQSKGMQRWLSMELARRFGVWANGDFPFPNAMVWRLFREVLHDVPEESGFSPEVMTWRIVRLLPDLLERSEFDPLRNYLADDRDGLKLYQLAGKIADTFDQYTLFRPEMLLGWEREEGKGWQEILWRELAAEGEGRHRARLREEFLHAAAGLDQLPDGIPLRMSLFGISGLPSYHLEVFAAVSRVAEVNLFLLSPTREYWEDIVTVRDQAKRRPEERVLLTEGNPLLASLGRLGRDFFGLMLECCELAAGCLDLYEDPVEGSLLRVIQSDILNLRCPGERDEPLTPDPADRSVQVHSCHGPMREMEVLFDNILALLEETPGLAPRDIVVMTPDIEAYAPYISAVFEGRQDPARRLPFSIADRRLAREGEIAPALLKLLALPGSRMTVLQVLDILESPAVCRRFELNPEDRELVRAWLAESRVRWGLDAGDRARFGLPRYGENSWQAAVDRLLLGHAMPDENDALFNGILPCGGIEGSRSRTLGSFLEFLSRVRDLAGRLGNPMPLRGWRDELRALLADFFQADDESARELAVVVSVVEKLGEMETLAGFTGQVSLRVIRGWLFDQLTREEKGFGFMTGGVTFCELLPMRSIPFRVVALVGMNDGAFPRQGRPPGFDLMAANPRRGDRSLRDEDRYLFLEALLSARDYFLVSYVGQSIRDNSEIPPSVLVSELLDYIASCFGSAGGDAVKQVLTRHRLQSFSAMYFEEGSRLFSYSREDREALERRRSDMWQASPFVARPLPPLPEEWREVPLARLLSFFRNPARFFLENRLGLRLEEVAPPLPEREPFELEGLDGYQLKEELVEHVLQGGNPEELLPVIRARGLLPPARHGEAAFRRLADEAAGFAESVKRQIAGRVLLEPLDFILPLGEFTLSGRLDGIREHRLVRSRCAKLKAKDLLLTWIDHLVLNCLGGKGYPRESLLIMQNETKLFGAVAEPGSILEKLLGLYWEGLSMPLPFFPEAAFAFDRNGKWQMAQARKKWENSHHGSRTEGDDPSIRLCFGEVDPFDSEFERVSRAVFEPLVMHLTEG